MGSTRGEGTDRIVCAPGSDVALRRWEEVLRGRSWCVGWLALYLKSVGWKCLDAWSGRGSVGLLLLCGILCAAAMVVGHAKAMFLKFNRASQRFVGTCGPVGRRSGEL